MPDYLHSLIPFADFKALLSIDDREDTLSRFCLTTATYTIEHYCHRRLLKKRRSEYLAFTGDGCFPSENSFEFPLGDYPVREILAVYVQKIRFPADLAEESELVKPDLYHTIPGCGEGEDIPFCLSVSPGYGWSGGCLR